MTNQAVWTGQTGKQELVSEMQENHLMNAYAKSVRENTNAAIRPALAEEISERGLSAQLPAYAIAALNTDLPLALAY